MVLDEGATATLIDEYGSAPETAATNGASPRIIAHVVTEAHIGKNAQLQYVNVQNWGSRTRSHYTQTTHVGDDGRAASVSVALGGLYNKTSLVSELRGANAYSEMIGV